MELGLLYEHYLHDSTLEISKDEIFLAIESHPYPQQKAALFTHILETRLAQITELSPSTAYLNIAGKLSAPSYLNYISRHPFGLSPIEYQIEQLALTFFDNICDFWCEYEIYRITAKYLQPGEQTQQTHNALSYDERHYQAALIDGVEHVQQHYYTLHCPQPLLLADAILLTNLSTFIKQHRWYEMLESLELSCKGTHFLLMTHCHHQMIPTLVSTARIQTWSQRSQWLYFSAFFQSPAWTPYLQPGFEQHLRTQLALNEHAILDASSIVALDSSLSESILDKGRICEILRLTTSGNTLQCAFIIYLAQKRLMSLLRARQFAVGFVVIEQPLMMRYYAQLTSGEYLYTAICNLQDTGNPTFKGLWLIDKLDQQLSATTYKEYKNSVFNQKKPSNGIAVGENSGG